MVYRITDITTRPNGEEWYTPTTDNHQDGELTLLELPRDYTDVYAMAEEELHDYLNSSHETVEVPIVGEFDMAEVFHALASDTDKRIAIGEVVSQNWTEATYLEAVSETADCTDWTELLPTSDDYAPDYAETLHVEFSGGYEYEVELSHYKVRYRPYNAEYGRRSWTNLEDIYGLTLDELLDTIEYEIEK